MSTCLLVGCAPAPDAPSLAAEPSPAVDGGAHVSPAARRPHLWLLGVGVSEYRDPRLRLQYAADDARAFADELKRQEGGPLYEQVHTRLLLNQAATRESILQAIDSFLGDASPVDVAVLFFAGHGMRTTGPTAFYFLPEPASPTAPHIAGLEMQELHRQILRVHRNVPRVVVILDTCHGGAVTSAGESAELGADLASDLSPAEGLYVLTAASPGERSFELAAERHGAFTHSLLEGLRGGAAGADGLITVSGLWSYASQTVPRLTDHRQRPYISILGADLALASDPSRPAAVTPPPVAARGSEADSPRARERIAIPDFEYYGGDESFRWMHRVLSQDAVTAFSELHQLDVYDDTMLRFVTRDGMDPIEAAQRAGVKLLVQGSYWVQNNQLSLSAQVKSVHPLRMVATARAHGSVDQFAQLTGELMIQLFEQLEVDASPSLIAQLRQKTTGSLEARRMLAEAEGEESPREPEPPGTPRSVVPPRARLLGEGSEGIGSTIRVAWDLASWLTPRIVSPSFAQEAVGYEAELASALEKYRQALQAKDVEALRGCYESFTPSQEAALTKYFAGAEGLQIDFSDVRIARIGETAAVSLTRRDRFTDRNRGEPQDVSIRVTKRFTKTGGVWLIAN